jgi:hypothetical protein
MCVSVTPAGPDFLAQAKSRGFGRRNSLTQQLGLLWKRFKGKNT